MKTSKTESLLIIIMKSSNLYELGFKQTAQPVVFTQLSLTVCGIKVSNSYHGSNVTALNQVQLTFDKDLLIPIDEICQKTIYSLMEAALSSNT